MTSNKFKYSTRNLARDCWYWLDRQRFKRYYSRSTEPMILCYSMGKVGSTTILRALKKTQFQNQVQHVHFLNQDKLPNIAKLHRSSGFSVLPAHLYASNNILDILSRNPDTHVITISPVRDPIAFIISNFFQNPYFFDNFKRLFSDDNVDEMLKFIQKELLCANSETLEYWNSWYEIEFEKVTKINLSHQRFNKSRGWSIYSKGNFRSGIIKLETLSDSFEDFSGELLGQPLTLNKEKYNDRKKASGAYHSVLQNIKVENDTLRQIYEMRWVKFFYSDSEIDNFKMRWSGQ